MDSRTGGYGSDISGGVSRSGDVSTKSAKS